MRIKPGVKKTIKQRFVFLPKTCIHCGEGVYLETMTVVDFDFGEYGATNYYCDKVGCTAAAYSFFNEF